MGKYLAFIAHWGGGGGKHREHSLRNTTEFSKDKSMVGIVKWNFSQLKVKTLSSNLVHLFVFVLEQFPPPSHFVYKKIPKLEKTIPKSQDGSYCPAQQMHSNPQRFQKSKTTACHWLVWTVQKPEARVLKKLSLAGFAKLRWLRYSWLRFGLASADYREIRSQSPQ